MLEGYRRRLGGGGKGSGELLGGYGGLLRGEKKCAIESLFSFEHAVFFGESPRSQFTSSLALRHIGSRFCNLGIPVVGFL